MDSGGRDFQPDFGATGRVEEYCPGHESLISDGQSDTVQISNLNGMVSVQRPFPAHCKQLIAIKGAGDMYRQFRKWFRQRSRTRRRLRGPGFPRHGEEAMDIGKRLSGISGTSGLGGGDVSRRRFLRGTAAGAAGVAGAAAGTVVSTALRPLR